VVDYANCIASLDHLHRRDRVSFDRPPWRMIRRILFDHHVMLEL
jgi:hypothetical protein